MFFPAFSVFCPLLIIVAFFVSGCQMPEPQARSVLCFLLRPDDPQIPAGQDLPAVFKADGVAVHFLRDLTPAKLGPVRAVFRGRQLFRALRRLYAA
jgi:hypothetical protein